MDKHATAAEAAAYILWLGEQEEAIKFADLRHVSAAHLAGQRAGVLAGVEVMQRILRSTPELNKMLQEAINADIRATLKRNMLSGSIFDRLKPEDLHPIDPDHRPLWAIPGDPDGWHWRGDLISGSDDGIRSNPPIVEPKTVKTGGTCDWCGKPATGLAIQQRPLGMSRINRSCGKHGKNFTPDGA